MFFCKRVIFVVCEVERMERVWISWFLAVRIVLWVCSSVLSVVEVSSRVFMVVVALLRWVTWVS